MSEDENRIGKEEQSKSEDEIKAKKIAEVTGLSEDDILDGLKKISVKLKEKLAPLHQLSKEDPAIANRIISRSENIARKSYYDAIMNETNKELNEIVDSAVLDGIYRLVEIDSGHGTIAPIRGNNVRYMQNIDKHIDYLLYNSDKEDSKNIIVNRIVLKDGLDLKNIAANLGNNINENIDENAKNAINNAKTDEERLMIATTIENELRYKGKPEENLMNKKTICMLIASGNNEYALSLAKKYQLDIIDIDKDGNETINKEEALKQYKNEEFKAWLDTAGIEDLESNEAKEFIASMEAESQFTYENLANEFSTYCKYTLNRHPEGFPSSVSEIKKLIEKDIRQEFFYNQILHNDISFEKDMTEWISGNVKSAEKFLEEFQSGNVNVNDAVVENLEIMKKITAKVKLKESFTKNSQEFKNDIRNIVPENTQMAQDFLKEMLNGGDNDIKDYQQKVMILQESIKNAEKAKLHQAFMNGGKTFEDNISEIVRNNPLAAQEFLQEFLQDGTKTVAEYGEKVVFLQQSIAENTRKKSSEKDKDDKKVFPNADEVDLSEIKKQIPLVNKEDEEPSL